MAYTRVNWEDGSTSHNTPISAENLNKMDAGIKELDTNKANKSGGDFTDDISVNLSGDASKPYIATDYENGSVHINDKHGSAIDYKIGRVVQTHSGDTCQQIYPNKSGTFVVTDGDGNTDLGSNTIESGVTHSVAEGYNNTIDDYWTDACHVEGFHNTVRGSQTHAEGSNSSATGDYSHAEGHLNTASGEASHAEGYNNTVSALYAHAEGGANTASGTASHAEGTNNVASGARAHAEGGGTSATANDAHAEGANTDADGVASHAEGGNRNADGSSIESERTVTIGNETVSVLGPKAVGVASHAEGVRTLAYGHASHASGIDTDATGEGSYTEGYETKASGNYSHAEGYRNTVSGACAHAEGSDNTAIAHDSHVEGAGNTTSNGQGAHAEGLGTTAGSRAAHAEGYGTTASGRDSHSQNRYTIAGYEAQTAMGKYNNNKPTSLLEVGNGTDDDNRSNAMEVTAGGDLLIKNGGVSLYGVDENKEVLGAKNLLPLTLDNLKAINTTGSWTGNAYTLNGVTFTVNTDSLGSVSDIVVNGTKEEGANNVLNLTSSLLLDNSNDYWMTGGTTGINMSARYVAEPYDFRLEQGNGIAVPFERERIIYINPVTAGTYNNVKIYPMIRLATDPNNTYRPYAMSNQELTQRLLALEARVTALENA